MNIFFLKLRNNLVLMSILVSIGASEHAVAGKTENIKISIYSVNYPLKYFAETIAGRYAKVEMPMPKDIDPAFWEPDAISIAGFQQADLIILNGAGYAKWLSKVSLPQSGLVNSSASFENEYIHINNTTTHKHGSGGEHAHKGTAFTTWLDFSMAARQAEVIYNKLVRKLTDQHKYIQVNYELLQKSLKALDSELIGLTQDKQQIYLIGSHPVYQYLKHRYKLNLQSVHWEPEEVPNEEQWDLFSQMIKDHPAKWMLWEAEPALETVARLEQLGIHSIVFNPCSNVPEQGDFLSEMKNNIENLKKVLQ